ncbi:trypsin-like peptidase domain-containing protein [Cyanobacterium stanieri LEGE 03274]|uniref:Trypsin-like peptidase domain-containing protein n=1 Tax=Cyanobacterium stanieri LEGE 03274 TaxID=1828756 RepID=A0ABR9V7W1_9CHRO|nr:trypsin-like peptidase domain-containing protein [Cyanobacterium stanieri]MBE9223606.1 trypsin-like peptidase domain-containing protein [Cyanobacterium stanieri LEGE 03274]
MDSDNFTIGIIEGDSRGIVNDPSVFPFNSVVTVDSKFDGGGNANLIGSGVLITPNHVLTAAHLVYSFNNGIPSAVRTTPSAFQGSLNSRIIGNELDSLANVNGINYLVGFEQISHNPKGLIPFNQDIALLTTNDNPAPVAPEDMMGIVTFVDPASALGLNIRSAGFPGDGRTIENNTTMEKLNGRTLVESPQILDPENPNFGSIRRVGDRTINPKNNESIDLVRIIYFSFNIDVEGGQSGSPVWHILEGDNQPRILGLITGSVIQNPLDLAIDYGNSGILITTDIYNNITNQLKKDGWENLGNSLPENAMVGSENNDLIIGSFRRERIMAVGGDNLLFGGKGDDRLEGAEGIDLALFTESVENYQITLEDTDKGIVAIAPKQENSREGKDLLTNIELAMFGYDVSLPLTEQKDITFLPLTVEPNQEIINNLVSRFPHLSNINDLILPSLMYEPVLENKTSDVTDSLTNPADSATAQNHNNSLASLLNYFQLNVSGVEISSTNSIPWLETNQINSVFNIKDVGYQVLG